MIVLGLDTATAMTCVALYDTERGPIGESRGIRQGSHAESAIPHLDHLLKMTETNLSSVDLIAVGVGPGSFTGVRIALTMAKTLAQAKAIPLVAVSTLEALSYGVGEGLILPVMDARRDRVFTALFHSQGSKLERLKEDMVLPIEKLEELTGGETALVVGPAASLVTKRVEKMYQSVPSQWELSAVHVAALGATAYERVEIADYRTLVPTYVAATRADRMKDR